MKKKHIKLIKEFKSDYTEENIDGIDLDDLDIIAEKSDLIPPQFIQALKQVDDVIVNGNEAMVAEKQTMFKMMMRTFGVNNEFILHHLIPLKYNDKLKNEEDESID